MYHSQNNYGKTDIPINYNYIHGIGFPGTTYTVLFNYVLISIPRKIITIFIQGEIQYNNIIPFTCIVAI